MSSVAPSASPMREYESIFSIAARLMTGPRSVSGSQSGPDAHLLGAFDQPLRERVCDLLVHDHAARRSAALAGRPERRPHDALHREVEIGVVHDDDPVLATELEVDVLEVVGCALRHEDACLARAGEGDHRDVGMPDEPVACLLAEAVHEIDDTRRDTCLGEQLDEPLREHGCVLGRLRERPCSRRRARARASRPESRSESSRA